MVASPLELIKKIELELENPQDATVRALEPLLTEYKGADIRFQEKNGGARAEFIIGAGENQNKATMLITQNSDNTAKMILEITSMCLPDSEADLTGKGETIDILLQDILIHVLPGLKPKGKAKILEKGKICPSCQTVNEVKGKFCESCGFNFSSMAQDSIVTPASPIKPATPVISSKTAASGEAASLEKPAIPVVPEKPAIPTITSVEALEMPTKPDRQAVSIPDLVTQLDEKYKNKYECQLCDYKCAYKSTFILLLSEMKNLERPFKKFDDFLRTKDISSFADYIYEFSLAEMKKYPNYTITELPAIAYCIFSTLSWHILEKASDKIRLTFAKKMKEQINVRFNKENPSIPSISLMNSEADAPMPTIKTGALLIEENRCPYCYKKFDERTLKLKMKGYIVECPVCGKML
jgi:hypothetical protein